ncbi:MAG: HAD family hydrolase [Bdellovibrionaceae bacterium]|nr:HAD family hydrolase [Pseudobdellovibrionaceae bacterium]
MTYKAIAFDLDDTLIDTTNELIPFACRKIHTYLLSEGYPGTFEEFDVLRKNFVKTKSHKEFFKNLVSTFSIQDSSRRPDIISNLNQLFYEPTIPSHLTMMPGAEDNLMYLGSKYTLFVVTAGVVAAQKRKLAQLRIERYVKHAHVLIVGEGAFSTKKTAFEKILQDEDLRPQELLSIGNRLSQEIRMAKQLACDTCYFQHGEHAEDTAQDHFEIPDFTIHSHKELISTCRL